MAVHCVAEEGEEPMQSHLSIVGVSGTIPYLQQREKDIQERRIIRGTSSHSFNNLQEINLIIPVLAGNLSISL